MKEIKKASQLGRCIRDTRKKQALTQAELAAVSGVGLRFVRELEQGKESCHLGKVMTVLKMLGLILQLDGDDKNGADES